MAIILLSVNPIQTLTYLTLSYTTEFHKQNFIFVTIMAAFLCIDTVKNLLIQICLKVTHVMHVDTFDEKSLERIIALTNSDVNNIYIIYRI